MTRGMKRSTPKPAPVWISGLLATLLAAGPVAGAAPVSAPTVALLGLRFEGEVPAAVQREMAQRLAAGLTAARVKLAEPAAVLKALGGRRLCKQPECWKAVAAAVGCRYAVAGTVRGEDKSYDIDLFLGDAFTGAVVVAGSDPHRPVRCAICGLVEAGRKVELLASALVAKLEAAARALARVAVVSEPPGAVVVVDGDEVGAAPREIELGAGEHELVVRSPGYLAATRRVTAVAGVHERIEVRLVPLARASSPARVVGWVGIAAGVAAIGAGIALFAIDGQAIECAPSAPDSCQRRETTAAAAALVGGGAAAAGVGGILLYRARGTDRRAAGEAGLALGAGGARLSF
jgi:hypothetical protein